MSETPKDAWLAADAALAVAQQEEADAWRALQAWEAQNDTLA